MQPICKSFDQLSIAELYAILKLRSDVFVVEQQCIYADIDAKDRTSHHNCLWNEDQLIGYTRLLPPGLCGERPKLQRIIVAREFRGLGIGHRLVIDGLQRAAILYPEQEILINAQSQLQKFYETHGFVAIGEVYDDCGQPHIDMVFKPAAKAA